MSHPFSFSFARFRDPNLECFFFFSVSSSKYFKAFHSESQVWAFSTEKLQLNNSRYPPPPLPSFAAFEGCCRPKTGNRQNADEHKPTYLSSCRPVSGKSLPQMHPPPPPQHPSHLMRVVSFLIENAVYRVVLNNSNAGLVLLTHPHCMCVSTQLCLLAKCFKPALPFLELDMMDICKENGAYDAKHFLCYYYYGGMIYTGLKNFERALYFYEQVPARRSQTVSAAAPAPGHGRR